MNYSIAYFICFTTAFLREKHIGPMLTYYGAVDLEAVGQSPTRT